MTLDDAIKHCEEIAEAHDKLRKSYDDASGYSRSHNESIRTSDAKKHEKCNQDFRQLTEWLRELKAYKEQQPCDDAISRGFFMRDLMLKAQGEKDVSIKWLENYVNSLPTVQPTRKKGKWIESNIGGAKVCSKCQAHMGLSNFKFCPNCGAKMENEE